MFSSHFPVLHCFKFRQTIFHNSTYTLRVWSIITYHRNWYFNYMRKSWDYPHVRDAAAELTENGIFLSLSLISGWSSPFEEAVCPRRFQHTSCNREGALTQGLVQWDNKDVRQPSCNTFKAGLVTRPNYNISVFNYSIFGQIIIKVDTFWIFFFHRENAIFPSKAILWQTLVYNTSS